MAVSNQCWPIRRALVVVVVFLHALTTITFAAKWSFMRSAFVKNGQSFWTVFLHFNGPAQAAYWEMGIPASMSSILADSYMVCANPLGTIPSAHRHFDSRCGAVG